MAATYQYLPISIRDIFAEIVGNVSTNLSTESTLDIDQVSFKCETWIELIKRIQEEDKSSSHRSTKYPLVALIRNFDEKYSDTSTLAEVNLTLVIVTPSDINKYSEDRETDNYIPILRPIYAELMSQIKESQYFNGYYAYYPPHTCTESYQLGTNTEYGNKAHLLPDCVDAIIISDLKLNIYPEICRVHVSGANTVVTYLNNVEQLTVTNQINRLGVTLVSAQYIDTLNVANGTEYTIYFEHDNSTSSISIGGTFTTPTLNCEDGYYTGYISSRDDITDSKLYFFYRVIGNKVKGNSDLVKFKLQNFVTLGTQYTNYPFDVILRQKANVKLIAELSISIDGGNIQWNEVYQPHTLDTQEKTITVTESLSTTYRDVVNTVTIDQALTMDNIAYYKQS